METSHWDPEARFNQIADEFLEGYLAWRPQLGTSLGLHEYDGRLTDFSRASLEGERARLGRFQQALAALDPRIRLQYRVAGVMGLARAIEEAREGGVEARERPRRRPVRRRQESPAPPPPQQDGGGAAVEGETGWPDWW